MSLTETESFSFAILRLEEATQILREIETLRTNVVPALRQEQKELEARAQDARQESETLGSRLEKLREMKQIVETQIHEATTQKSEALRDLVAIQAEKEQLETNIHKHKHEAEVLRSILSDLSQLKQEADHKLQAQSMSLGRMREEKSNLETDFQEAKKACESLHIGVATLRKEHLETISESDKIRNEILALRDEKEKLEMNVRSLERALAVEATARNSTIDNRDNKDCLLPQTNDTHKDSSVDGTDENSGNVVTFGNDCSMIGNGDDDDDEYREEKEMEQSFDSTASLTDVSTSLLSLSSCAKKQQRVRRANSSPKKWRRMIRTHRLRSILINC